MSLTILITVTKRLATRLQEGEVCLSSQYEGAVCHGGSGAVVTLCLQSGHRHGWLLSQLTLSPYSGILVLRMCLSHPECIIPRPSA